MNDVVGMEVRETLAELEENAPDGLLREGSVEALALADVVAEVPKWGIFHDTAQLVSIQKGLVVSNLTKEEEGSFNALFSCACIRSYHIGVVDRYQQTNLINCVHALKMGERREVSLLERVELLVPLPLNFVDLAIRAFSEHLVDLRERARVKWRASEVMSRLSPLH